MTYQEFVKEYVGLDEDIIDEICKNLPYIKQLSIENIRGIQKYPDDEFRSLYLIEIRLYYSTISEDYINLITQTLSDINFPFCDFTKISRTLIEYQIPLDVALKLYLSLRKIYFKICGYDK